jgi:hypothetical protein
VGIGSILVRCAVNAIHFWNEYNCAAPDLLLMPHIKSAHAYNMGVSPPAALIANWALHIKCCAAAIAAVPGSATGIGTQNA